MIFLQCPIDCITAATLFKVGTAAAEWGHQDPSWGMTATNMLLVGGCHSQWRIPCPQDERALYPSSSIQHTLPPHDPWIIIPGLLLCCQGSSLPSWAISVQQRSGLGSPGPDESPCQSSGLGMSTRGKAVLGSGGRHHPCQPGLEALGWLIYPRPSSLSSQNSNHASCIISIL